jgi:hypothetical protein
VIFVAIAATNSSFLFDSYSCIPSYPIRLKLSTTHTRAILIHAQLLPLLLESSTPEFFTSLRIEELRKNRQPLPQHWKVFPTFFSAGSSLLTVESLVKTEKKEKFRKISIRKLLR